MKQVTDLLDVQVSMDDEDRELMRMFPRNRKTVLNDMLMVQDRNGAYLIRKEDAARWRKVLHGMVTAAAAAFGALMLVCSVVSAVLGVGHPGVFLAAFEVTLAPMLMKMPAAVRTGTRRTL